MNLNDFQTEALKSIAITSKGVPALAHRSLGLAGEAGTLANTIKKVIRDKDGMPDSGDVAEVKKRLGDVLYYTAVLAEYFDLKLSDVAEQNSAQSKVFLESRNKQS